ncbi:MAG: hypothetical protein IPO82_05555 [Betaproteobacteria bacterium]|nr:hypothetical protein [Betaproteobacteria bacterium]
MENEILKATAYFAKELLKYAWIDATTGLPLPALCATLAVSAAVTRPGNAAGSRIGGA